MTPTNTGSATRRRASLDLPAARTARGTVALPGSKSISIRALLMAAQSAGVTRLEGVLRSDDTAIMIDALRALGVVIDEPAADVVDVHGAPEFAVREADLFVGNSGLSIRTLTAALAFAGGTFRLSGIARMHQRPIGDLVDALTSIGARIRYVGAAGFAPLVIEPASLLATAIDGVRTITVSAGTSSQFLTGVLLAAPLLAADADLTIAVHGTLVSRPYIDLTIASLARFGIAVRETKPQSFTVAHGSRYAAPVRYAVEGDASSASYLLAAGLLGGGPLTIEGLGRDSVQGDARFVDVVVAMGGEVSQTERSTTVRAPGAAAGRRLRAIDANFNAMPDAAMTVAVLALFAEGPCTLRDIGSWRVKETDRLAAMAAELAKLGADVEAGDDWLRVAPLSAAAVAELVERAARGDPVSIATYDDHRIAMCFSLVPFAGVTVRIEDPDCVAKTFPDYFERLAAIVEPKHSTRPSTHAA